MSEPTGPGAAHAGPAYQPPKRNLRTLGWRKHLQDPFFVYYEHFYLKNLHKFLTEKWWILQGGNSPEALKEWLKVLKLLELDNKAKRDLFLMAQSGPVGRAQANKVLWKTLTGPALEPDYPDLSNLVTHEVYKARKTFDRPPRQNPDLEWWSWSSYTQLAQQDLKWWCLRSASTSMAPPDGRGREAPGPSGLLGPRVRTWGRS